MLSQEELKAFQAALAGLEETKLKAKRVRRAPASAARTDPLRSAAAGAQALHDGGARSW